MTVETMRKRAQIIQTIRAFFVDRGYLEVDTPALSAALIPESVITPFRTEFVDPSRGAHELYLLPSPELWMKRILARHPSDLFQISRCYRNSEQIGRVHNPEFTMLEWYTVNADYLASADLTDELLGTLTSPGMAAALRPPARRMSMEEAFAETAGIDLAACDEIGRLRDEVERAGLEMHQDAEWEELFNALFLQLVEPALPHERPLVLYNYPARVATLAKAIPGTPWCERWELYLDGIEVANCFSEETDPLRVAEFFRVEETRIRARGAVTASDRNFPELFGSGFPECSGVALGVDRLVMLLLGHKDIGGVIFFPFLDIFD